jgi:hypothetical protein
MASYQVLQPNLPCRSHIIPFGPLARGAKVEVGAQAKSVNHIIQVYDLSVFNWIAVAISYSSEFRRARRVVLTSSDSAQMKKSKNETEHHNLETVSLGS